MAKRPVVSSPDAIRKSLVALLRENAYRHRLREVFRDFCELTALTFSNAVDKRHFARREARYFDIIKRYQKEELTRFAEAIALLTLLLEAKMSDALGELFMELDFGSDWRGQFFTPYEVCRLLANLNMQELPQRLAAEGFLTMLEPACGAGAMVIASAEAMLEQSHNYQTRLHATAVDVDATAVHMAYAQLSLLHVPAIVIHGNSLTLECWDVFVTPAHVLGGWDRRLKRAGEPATLPHPSNPMLTLRNQVLEERALA